MVVGWARLNLPFASLSFEEGRILLDVRGNLQFAPSAPLPKPALCLLTFVRVAILPTLHTYLPTVSTAYLQEEMLPCISA
ncbi:hypothetical protein NSND_62238 [Nitrospira sp. ND1]|nr:hypothetical protein NSND_62238 [Nitrospira sp. ND1]